MSALMKRSASRSKPAIKVPLGHPNLPRHPRDLPLSPRCVLTAADFSALPEKPTWVEVEELALLIDGYEIASQRPDSAGSGKTNSIAWTAHFLAELHDAENNKIFDTVLVVSDRTVIDTQLQEAIFDFERTSGVVATITNKDGSKSSKLAEALDGSKKIVVCTIQTFPFALEAVRELAATKGKRFAVIADEAHSSQTGEAASKLKAVLSPEEIAELNDGGEVSTEDILMCRECLSTRHAPSHPACRLRQQCRGRLFFHAR